MDNVVIMIPAYNPDEKFITFVKNLRDSGYTDIIVINDGSRKDTEHFFTEAKEQYDCEIVSHSINLGQGRAYKSGFNYFLMQSLSGERYNNVIGIIQCDCDGQHCVEDINKCADLLQENPNSFIIGVRNFSDKNIPFRSRFGNKMTSIFFKFFCGINIQDTQSGLKGIPRYIIPKLMEIPGERFEYASSVLIEIQREGIEILPFPIQTIYINGNETSHFNPIVDSIRIYSLILRYLMSSLLAFVFDIILYSLFIRGFRIVFPEYYIIFSTYLSRLILCIYVFFFNKKMVFHNNEPTLPVAIKFFVLCAVQATVSGVTVEGIVHVIDEKVIISKVIVDTILFFASFQIQSKWVFKKNPIGGEDDRS